MHFEVASSAGKFLTSTFAAPGVHGVVTGMQGIGVSTPSAAAVAAATIGLAGDMHIPNVGTLVSGAQSMMFAAGGPCAVVVGTTTKSADGAAPIVHVSNDPAFTNFPAMATPSRMKDVAPHMLKRLSVGELSRKNRRSRGRVQREGEQRRHAGSHWLSDSAPAYITSLG
jgi:hypothetical protein